MASVGQMEMELRWQDCCYHYYYYYDQAEGTGRSYPGALLPM